MPIGLDMPYGINHTDHLESSTVITDQNGNKVEELLYYPFGERLSDTGSANVKYKYAGHEFDAETELIYMKARYYDPKLARFVSPDPVVPVRVELYNYRDFKLVQFKQLTNPQALNRYSYVVNNPIVFRDPFGLEGKNKVVGGIVVFLNRGIDILSLSPGTIGGIAGAYGRAKDYSSVANHAVQYFKGNETALEALCKGGPSLLRVAASWVGGKGLVIVVDQASGVGESVIDGANVFGKDVCKDATQNQYNPKPMPDIQAPPIDNSGQPKGGAGVESTSKQVSPGDSTSHTTTETPEVPAGSTGQGQLGGLSTNSQAGSQTTGSRSDGSAGYVPSSGNTYVGGDYGC